MDELGIIEFGGNIEGEDAKELVTILPTMALEHVVNSPDGIASKHSWGENWLNLCQDEYTARMLLL